MSITETYHSCAFSAGKTEGQSVLAVESHSSVQTCEDDASTAIALVVPCNKLLKIFIEKEQKQVSVKRFQKI